MIHEHQTPALRGSLQRRRWSWLRSATLAAFAGVLLFASGSALAQDSPSFKIEDEVTAFAFSASGRIAYATRHVFSVKKVQLQRDDIWIYEADGKKHRILQGEKFTRGTGAFSYTVRALRWSPAGSKLAVEMGTSEMINDDGDTREGSMTLLLEDSGGEIKAAADSVIAGASNAAWLADEAAVAYLLEMKAPDPKAPSANPPVPKTFTLHLARMGAIAPESPSVGQPVLTAAWDAKQNSGLVIERDPNAATADLRLMVVDLLRSTSRVLRAIEGYAGGLTISPSGRKAAYWIDNGRLEICDLSAPNRVVRIRVALGTLAWSGDETRVLVKRGLPRRSGSLVWIAIPPLGELMAKAAPPTIDAAPQGILHDLEFRAIDISPDGKLLGVIEPGKRNLVVYPIP